MEQAQVNAIVAEAKQAAYDAAMNYIKEHGEDWYCGFAWVTVYEKGSTKLGRALIKAGFARAYGGGLQMWNPSGHGTQSMSVKEAGAYAAAKVLKERLGVTAYAGGRAD